MSLEPANPGAAPTLSYSGLRSGSGIVSEPTEHGITIKVPPASIVWAFLACGFAALMLAPMTYGLFVLAFHTDRLDTREIFVAIFMSVVVLTFWSVVIFCMCQAIRRRRVPTICTINKTMLIVITPDLPTLRREFAIDPTLQISAIPRGIGVTFRPMGALRIQNGRAIFDLLRNRDLREVQWIAHTLNEAMQNRSATQPG